MATSPIGYVKRAGRKTNQIATISHETTLFKFQHDRPVEIGKLGFGVNVEIDVSTTEELFSQGIRFVAVQVKSGAGKGEKGFIPKSALNDSILAHFNHALTGVTYGGDKWLLTGERNVAVFPIDDEGKARCRMCGGKANSHKLYETKTLARMLFDLCHDLELQSGSSLYERTHPRSVVGPPAPPAGAGHGMMIGLVQTNEGYFIFGHSGLQNEPLFRDTVSAFCQRKKLKFLIANPIPRTGRLRNRSGGLVDMPRFQAAYGSAVTLDVFRCAAPRMLYLCNETAGLTPVAMTEIFVGRSETWTDLQTAKSCDTCRKVIPFMLCGLNSGIPG